MNINTAFDNLRGSIPEKINEIGYDINQYQEAKAAKKAEGTRVDEYWEMFHNILDEDEAKEKYKNTVFQLQSQYENAESPEDQGKIMSEMQDLMQAWKYRNKDVGPAREDKPIPVREEYTID